MRFLILLAHVDIMLSSPKRINLNLRQRIERLLLKIVKINCLVKHLCIQVSIPVEHLTLKPISSVSIGALKKQMLAGI